MNIPVLLILTLQSATAEAPAAPADGWRIEPGPQLIFREAGAPVYRFDCSGSGVEITNYGVTQLLDVQKNKPVGDSEGSALPAGAAVMALATDKTEEPEMVPATSARNAAGGWDMTIRLPKNDPAFRSLPRADLISLFTTGFTRAVHLEKEERKLVADFVRQCRGG
jgi:hypothetical protein